jgi:hypothetical protein
VREFQEGAEAKAPACEHAWSDHDVLVREPRRFWRYMIAGAPPE